MWREIPTSLRKRKYYNHEKGCRINVMQQPFSWSNKDLSETLQALMHKFICGDALQLYPNEIKGIDAIDWKEFPKALIVSDGKLLCGTIEERITEIDGLLDFVIS